MSSTPLRVALFTESFHEPNGVGTLSREFAQFSARREIPFLCVHRGTRTEMTTQGSLSVLELKQSATAVRVDAGGTGGE